MARMIAVENWETKVRVITNPKINIVLLSLIPAKLFDRKCFGTLRRGENAWWVCE